MSDWPCQQLPAAFPPWQPPDLILARPLGAALDWKQDQRGRRWLLPKPVAIAKERTMQAIRTLEKFHDDDRIYSFDFSLQPEILAGDGIAAAQVTASPVDGNLVISNINISSPPDVSVELRGGAPGVAYLITCVMTTDGVGSGFAAVIAALGKLSVVDPSNF